VRSASWQFGAVVHAVVDQEASKPQFKKTEEATKDKQNNEAKEKKAKF
jgi:hypothetical protein